MELRSQDNVFVKLFDRLRLSDITIDPSPKVSEAQPEAEVDIAPLPTEEPFKFDPNSTTNEGRWRLKDPQLFTNYFRRKSKDPGVSYVMGHNTQTHKVEVQAIRFNKKELTEEAAAAWWEMNKSRFEKVWGQADWDKLAQGVEDVGEAVDISKVEDVERRIEVLLKKKDAAEKKSTKAEVQQEIAGLEDRIDRMTKTSESTRLRIAERHAIVSVLEPIVGEVDQMVNTQVPIMDIKMSIIDKITATGIKDMDKKKLIIDILRQSDPAKLQKFLYNALLKYEGLGVTKPGSLESFQDPDTGEAIQEEVGESTIGGADAGTGTGPAGIPATGSPSSGGIKNCPVCGTATVHVNQGDQSVCTKCNKTGAEPSENVIIDNQDAEYKQEYEQLEADYSKGKINFSELAQKIIALDAKHGSKPNS